MTQETARAVEQLVGRREELAVFERAIVEIESDSARVVAVSGEPGIGKTRLLVELERLAEGRRYLVLNGRASEIESDLPYWIFVDALDDYLRSLDSDRLEQVAAEFGGELARIFPALSGLGGDDGTVLDERYKAHRAVRGLLEGLAADKPFVLVLDDLHWADPGSVELVSALLRRPPQARVLLALALRPRQASRLTAALEQATRTGMVERLELGALNESEAKELVGRWLEPHLSQALYSECGGNPFYLEQIARNVQRPARTRAGLATPLTIIGEADVPPAVGAALREELESVSARARRFLEGAAVVGDPFELELAGAAAEASDTEALKALDELLSLDLVRKTETPRRLRFRHPLVRRAVYEAAPSGWKLAAHGRAARALAERGEPVTAWAHHLEHCAVRGDRQAVALLNEAAQTSKARAPGSAARWYRVALELLPESEANREERVGFLMPLAEVLAGTGQFTESRTALLEALELAPQRAMALRVKLTAACAGVEHLIGLHDDAHARLVTAFEDLTDHESSEAATLMLDLASDAFFRADYESMRDWALRALAAANLVGRAPLIAAARAAASLASAFEGRTDEAKAHRALAATLLDALPDPELAARLDAASHLVAAEIYLDHYQDAIAHADRGLEVGRASGQGQLFPQLTQSKAVALVMLGRLNEAADILDGAIEAARLSGSPQTVSWALFNRSWTALQAGDLDTALRTGKESADLVRDLDDSMISPFAAGLYGSALAEAGEPAQCLDLLVPAAGGPELPRIPGVWKVVFHEVATRAWLGLRSLPEADLAAARAERAADGLGLNLATALARRARAAVLLAAGDPRASAELALSSAAAAEAIYAPLEAARARTLAGRALIAAGERPRAAAELERAAAEFDARGAVRYRDEAERELRRIGRRYSRRSGMTTAVGEIASLTGRELEIAALVRNRKTNREIAAQLFLSEKTVETHLRHIFDKLGVASRASVARALEEAGQGHGRL
jgi:DNA-binding CsgD family transcriptional regulator/tetratricopeptide (TPR) repeat protein